MIQSSGERTIAAPTILALIVVLTFSSTLHGLEGKNQKAKDKAPSKIHEDLFDRFFLIRPSDFGQCRKESELEAIVIFRVGTHRGSVKPGEEFFVITPWSKVLKGIVKETLEECEPKLIFDNVVLGLLSLETPITWPSEQLALLGVKGVKPSESQVGSITPVKAARERQPYLNKIRAQIPKREQLFPPDVFVREFVKINLPRSDKEYVFAAVDHADPREYSESGDHAVKSTGFLFVRHNKAASLLVKETYLTQVIGVTDLNDDGIHQVLVHTGSGSGGSYEMRLFDGKKLTKPRKILYEWVD